MECGPFKPLGLIVPWKFLLKCIAFNYVFWKDFNCMAVKNKDAVGSICLSWKDLRKKWGQSFPACTGAAERGRWLLIPQVQRDFLVWRARRGVFERLAMLQLLELWNSLPAAEIVSKANDNIPCKVKQPIEDFESCLFIHHSFLSRT